MRIYQEQIKLKTRGFNDLIDITPQVSAILDKSEIQEGLGIVFIKGSTAGITTLEYEPNLVKDFQELIEKLVSQKKYYHDNTWGDDNGFSHLRASLLGPSFSFIINKGNIVLGTWQQIVLADFDNREREREVLVKIIGE